ncbi:MAG: response regulator transcription factor [Chitinophagales bacterium]
MSKPRILIIDDEPQIRRLLQIALGNNDFEVEEAATAKEGIALAASLQPEVILLDIGLPDVSGHEVLKELRSWYERPVIILSALDTETDIVHALDSGANDYLVKPFRTGELMARIRTALRSTNGTGTESQFMVDDIVLDISAHTVSCSGEQVKLTTTNSI